MTSSNWFSPRTAQAACFVGALALAIPLPPGWASLLAPAPLPPILGALLLLGTLAASLFSAVREERASLESARVELVGRMAEVERKMASLETGRAFGRV
jgi:hypothetical protein